MATGGLYGNTSTTVNTFFTWFIYQQSVLNPATPTGGVWNFIGNTGVPPSGWSNTPPANPTQAVWVSVAFVNSQNPLFIQWSVPAQFSTAAAAAPYPPAGIPNSLGSSWSTSYGVTGTGSTVVLSVSPTIAGTANIANITSAGTSALGITTVTAPTYPDNSTRVVDSAYVLSATNAVALPNQTGNEGLQITTDGTTATWGINTPGALAILNTISFGF